MHRVFLTFCALAGLLAVTSTDAATHFVDANNSSPTAPYTNWSTAARILQDAVDAAAPGDVVLVTNGVYASGGAVFGDSSNRVVVTNSITVQSVNGPAVTLIVGNMDFVNSFNSTRCAFLTNGAVLSGFTLTNGSPNSGLFNGAGVFCASTNELVANCLIISNQTLLGGGGVFGGVVSNCTIFGNSGGNGGGANSSLLINSTVLSNFATAGGGAYNSTLINCLVLSNTAQSGNGGGANNSTIYNSTITGNSSAGIYYGGYSGPGTVNSIICSNGGANYFQNGGDFINYCLTTPLPNSTPAAVGNFTNPPTFVDPAHGDFHLTPNSAGVNRGNNALVALLTDFDGNPRTIGAAVDVGAYEVQTNIHIRYVDANGTNPISGFISWTTAATNIQDALDASAIDDLIMVADGTYQYGGAFQTRASVSNRVTLQSVNGAATTIILGQPQNVGGGFAGVSLCDGSVLAGFTVSNCYSPNYGGGINCQGSNALVLDCIIGGNSANTAGGGAFGGTFSNCTFISNSSASGGAVAGLAFSPFNRVSVLLLGCTLTGNSAARGGGAYGDSISNCLLQQCILSGNLAQSGGGAYSASLSQCTLTGNTALGPSVIGGGGGAYSSTLDHCLLQANLVTNSSTSAGGGASKSTLINCSLIANINGCFNLNGSAAASGTLVDCLVASNICTATFASAALAGISASNCTIIQNSGYSSGGAIVCALVNCIVVSNTTQVGSTPNWSQSSLTNCCTSPLPPGPGNISVSPSLVSFATGNFRLQSNSPCINAGNNLYLTNLPTDLDDNPRVTGGTVDIGAFEFQNPTSFISYAWLQQFGLPTDGSADNLDSDGDGLNNFQEWRVGTNPTNAASFLQLLNPTNSGTNLVVTWQSATNIAYFLQRSTDLTPSSFQTIATNIAGRTNTTFYIDHNAPLPGPWFYRVGVQ